MNAPEFYVGYFPRMPQPMARFLRSRLFYLLSATVLVIAVLVFSQAAFDNSSFAFGHPQKFEGVVQESPYPMLIAAGQGKTYVLVGAGKHGAAAAVDGLQGYRVRLLGTLIERPFGRAIEVEPGRIEIREPASGDLPTQSFGQLTLTGEIVDTKCYFGVMNPGRGKVHRDCAVRCISGGIPPGFLVRDSSGSLRTMLLAGSRGEALHSEVLPFVGEPLRLQGELERRDQTLVFRVDPSTFRRLAE